jgi:hypothetical protein
MIYVMGIAWVCGLIAGGVYMAILGYPWLAALCLLLAGCVTIRTKKENG